MENALPLKVLLVAEGSGGHLIPALEVANALAKAGARTQLWYAQRAQTAPLACALVLASGQPSVDVSPIPIERARSLLDRLRHCTQLWSKSQRCFDTFAPDVVVGFGGWVCAPVVLAAKRRGILCVLHEQNVMMGRTNRWLARWVDRVTVSFRETQQALRRTPSVVTGMPVREAIGRSSRTVQAARFGFNATRPTLLVLGGSQGSQAINRLMLEIVSYLSAEERSQWQVLHITGMADADRVKEAYARWGLQAYVAPYLVDMGAAYAQADLVLGRAGASTVAELARSGTPAILIPYPYAGGHQSANARAVESAGGGIILQEREATPERLLRFLRMLLPDQRVCAEMGSRISSLAVPDAAQQITRAIVDVGQGAR